MIFDLVGTAVFLFLIGYQRARRPPLRTSRVVVGGIIFGGLAGLTWGKFGKPDFGPDTPAVAIGALIGAAAGVFLATILISYVSQLERDELWESREKKRREERIAKGLDPAANCFIATAVFGTSAPEVEQLRKWRDQRLIPFPIRRRLVAFYYLVSPFIARVIERSTFLKCAVRSLLRLVISLFHVD